MCVVCVCVCVCVSRPQLPPATATAATRAGVLLGHSHRISRGPASPHEHSIISPAPSPTVLLLTSGARHHAQGCSGGLGSAIAEAFALEGAHVIVCHVGASDLAEATKTAAAVEVGTRRHPAVPHSLACVCTAQRAAAKETYLCVRAETSARVSAASFSVARHPRHIHT